MLLSQKDEQLFSLQAIIEQLRQVQEQLLAQAQEGIRKGWQLEEFTTCFLVKNRNGLRSTVMMQNMAAN